jgi:hypothetical protein
MYKLYVMNLDSKTVSFLLWVFNEKFLIWGISAFTLIVLVTDGFYRSFTQLCTRYYTMNSCEAELRP